MKEDKKGTTKIVKGGFRATLALFFSIIALIISVVTFNRTTTETEYQIEITELKNKLEKMKQETAERISKIRQETANAIKKFGIEVKRKDETQDTSENQ